MTHRVSKKASKQWRKMSHLACFCAVSKNPAIQRGSTCKRVRRPLQSCSHQRDEWWQQQQQLPSDEPWVESKRRNWVKFWPVQSGRPCVLHPVRLRVGCSTRLGRPNWLRAVKVWNWLYRRLRCGLERRKEERASQWPPPEGRRGFLSGIGVWRSLDL